MSSRIFLAALVTLLAACTSTFKETHYFKSAPGPSGGIPNYFRLTVSGFADISSSRYVSGYFDEETINTYFNEYTQPQGAALRPRSGTGSAPQAGATNTGTTGGAGAVEPVADSLRGKKLIMILSSNSDEVATQIGALAASKQFTASLVGLVARDQFVAADQSEQQLAIERSRAKTTVALGDQIVASVPVGSSAATAERQLLVLTNALARDLGYDGIAFARLDDADRWLNANRARLQRGVR